MKDHLEVCEAAARAGGRVLQEWLGKFGVSNKGPRDLVTEADIASQREIRRIVLEAFPDHGFIGEESIHDDGHGGVGDAGGFRWYVDPLDGTSNYVHGFPAYCVSVALARGDEILAATIHDPLHDECFTARAGGGAFLVGGGPASSPSAIPGNRCCSCCTSSWPSMGTSAESCCSA